MSEKSYCPDRGDLVEMNFQPSAGREIDKRRPAIVLSQKAYNRKSGLCLAVPLTSDLTPNTTYIPMPPGFVSKPSLILCDYLKSQDYRERSATFIAKVPKSLIDEITSQLIDLIDPI